MQKNYRQRGRDRKSPPISSQLRSSVEKSPIFQLTPMMAALAGVGPG